MTTNTCLVISSNHTIGQIAKDRTLSLSFIWKGNPLHHWWTRKNNINCIWFSSSTQSVSDREWGALACYNRYYGTTWVQRHWKVLACCIRCHNITHLLLREKLGVPVCCIRFPDTMHSFITNTLGSLGLLY